MSIRTSKLWSFFFNGILIGWQSSCVTGLLRTVTVEGLPIFLLTDLSECLHWSNLSWMHIKLRNAQTFRRSQILI